MDKWKDPRIPPKLKYQWWDDPRFEAETLTKTLQPTPEPTLKPISKPVNKSIVRPTPKPIKQETKLQTRPVEPVRPLKRKQHESSSACGVKSDFKCLPLSVCVKTLGMSDYWTKELRVKHIWKCQCHEQPYKRYMLLLSVINTDVYDLLNCVRCLRERWKYGPRLNDKHLERTLNSLMGHVEWIKKELDTTTGNYNRVEELIRVYINCRKTYNKLKKIYFSEDSRKKRSWLPSFEDMIASDVDDLRESVRRLYNHWMLGPKYCKGYNIKLLSLMTYLKWLHQDLKCTNATKDQMLTFLEKYYTFWTEYNKFKAEIFDKGIQNKTSN